MSVLRRVTIKNFRSIVREDFEPSDLTILVGKNDSGKSNFLRALNLFFNGHTDPATPLVFASDFSAHTRVGRGKARQIEVWLDIQPPASFSEKSLIRWKRAWRDSGSGYVWQQVIRLKDGSEIGGRSKILPWLSKIRYRYVPAIKGSDYFASLLRDVHDVLAETVDRELREASGSFIDTIREHTAQISELTAKALGMQSRLQLPTDLRALFEVLDFETSYGSLEQSLKQRGDGVKVRHISSILKYLADQELSLAGSGRTKPVTIWGYEEPENNLELSQAFMHAAELKRFSEEIQIFVTTHSPAFYSLATEDVAVTAFSVSPSPAGTTLKPVGSVEVSQLDESLGLMTFVAPYVAKQAKRLLEIEAEARELASRIAERDLLLILTSGQTDSQYVATALDLAMSAQRRGRVKVSHVGSAAPGGASGGGDSHLLKFAKEISAQENLGGNRLLVLLDSDVNVVPASTETVSYFRLPINEANDVYRRGIENLLPKELALPDFVSETMKDDGYGAITVVRKLSKQRLCDAVCDPNYVLPVPFSERFAGFSSLLAEVDRLAEEHGIPR